MYRFSFSGHCNLANYSQPGVHLDSNFVLQEKIKNHDLTQQQRGLFVRRHSQNNSVLSKKFLSYLAIVDLTCSLSNRKTKPHIGVSISRKSMVGFEGLLAHNIL